METQPQPPIIVRAEKPAQEQVLKTLYDMTVKKAIPADLRLWSFVSSRLIYSEPVPEAARGLLASYFEGANVNEREIRNSVRPKTPIINPASTYTYTIRIEGQFNNETFTQTFTLGTPGGRVEYLTFGSDGAVQVAFTQAQKGMFLCLHPNNADSPLYWSEERKRKAGVYIENAYPSEQLFRNGWSAAVDVNRPAVKSIDLACEKTMSTLYGLSEQKFEQVCEACLGPAFRTVGHDSERRARLGTMVRAVLPGSLQVVSSAMTGTFLNIHKYVSKAAEVGLIRYDSGFSIWSMRGSDDDKTDGFDKYAHIPSTEVATGTSWSDQPEIYLARLIDGQVDGIPRPSVFIPLRNRVDALAKEFKATRKEEEEAQDPNWMPDDEFIALATKALESGKLIATKNALSWGDAQVGEDPVCKLANGEDPVKKLLKLKVAERSAIIARLTA